MLLKPSRARRQKRKLRTSRFASPQHHRRAARARHDVGGRRVGECERSAVHSVSGFISEASRHHGGNSTKEIRANLLLLDQLVIRLLSPLVYPLVSNLTGIRSAP